MKQPLDALLDQAALLPARHDCIAALSNVADTANRLPDPEWNVHGFAKVMAAAGLRSLLRAAERFRNADARAKLCAGIGLIAEAIRAERDVPKAEPYRHWMRESA